MFRAKSIPNLILVSFAINVLLPMAAFAYIPPSQFIVKNMVAKHSGLKGLRIRSTVTGLENDKPTTNQFKVITWLNPATGLLRLSATDLQGQLLYSVDKRSKEHTLLDHLLFDGHLPRVTEALLERSIPVKTEAELLKLPDEEARRAAEVEGLARWGKGAAWVIGDREKLGNQLWVEKDTFIPVQLILNPQSETERTELLLENYRFNHEFPYPRQITLVRGRKVAVFKDEATEVAVDPDLASLKTPLPVTGYTEAGNAAPAPIRELIRVYFETIR